MALKDIVEHLDGSLLAVHDANMGNIQIGGQNLAQGLGVVHNLSIQAQSGVSDDPAIIAALQTASRSPAQGANSVAP